MIEAAAVECRDMKSATRRVSRAARELHLLSCERDQKLLPGSLLQAIVWECYWDSDAKAKGWLQQ
jgi:hypothetical protein